MRLGAREELEVVRAAIFSSAEEAEATALACQIAGRLRDVDVASNQRPGVMEGLADVFGYAAGTGSIDDLFQAEWYLQAS